LSLLQLPQLQNLGKVASKGQATLLSIFRKAYRCPDFLVAFFRNVGAGTDFLVFFHSGNVQVLISTKTFPIISEIVILGIFLAETISAPTSLNLKIIAAKFFLNNHSSLFYFYLLV
jgi:hypothetical protein